MSKHHTTASAEEAIALFDLDLKNRALAALLAWLVPGLGHLYQGRTAKGLMFMICLVTTFGFGYYVGGGRVVYASTAPIDGPLFQVIGEHWRFPLQAGIGSVAIPAVIERQRALGGKAALAEAFRPPNLTERASHTDEMGETVLHPNELAKWQYLGGFYFELGTVYTAIAGMLNILVVYDAWAGPLIIRKNEPEGAGDIGADQLGDDKPNSGDTAAEAQETKAGR